MSRSIDDIARDSRSAYRTVEEMVVAAIREAVLSGVYGPGDRLPQEKLAQALGASRIPVRAALRQLEAEGLVVFTPHRGATVRRLTASDIGEMYELRVILETYALRSAVDRITSAEIDELEQMADSIDRMSEGEGWLEMRQRFHDRLYAIADRPITSELIKKLRADVGRYWLSFRLVDPESHSHRVLVDAIRSRDAPAGAAWLADHLRAVSAELQRRVAAEEKEPTT